MNDKIRTLIDNLKHLPGVYLMFNKDDTIIYVGKAKDLYKRVSQYFLRPQNGKVFKMVSEVEYFQTIITANEKEALVLEMNLIQTHYPRYNILLKDDSHYPYIAIKKSGYPYLAIKRNDKDKNYIYFGPYPNASHAYQMMDLLNKIFLTRKCKNIPHSSCLYYHLGTCLAPCINKIDEDVSSSIKEEIKSFMRGNNHKQMSEIKNKMLEASEKQEYERALDYKKILDAINHINTTQNVEMSNRKDRDIFAFEQRNGYICIAILLYRKGILLGKDVFTIEQFGEEEEQVSDMILQYYQKHPLPMEVVVNNPHIKDYLEGFLDCHIVSVTKGKLFELVVSAKENAANVLDEYFLSARLETDKLALLDELGHILNIATPLHIELFDNSHLQGSSPVGAMVAFINGEPAKNLYRKFKIENDNGGDDLQNMYEVTYRHYKRLFEENKKLPDLLLVDGGINQIQSANKALANVGVDIPVFGLVKNDKHQTDGLMDTKGNLYVLNNKKIFFMLTRMQDEVHRFAISFHKEKRNKAMKSSLLDNIPGLGQKRKESLYRAYPDITQLKKASISELEQLLPSNVAKALYQKLHE